MWPGVSLCRECKVRYTLHAVCPLCVERAAWREAGRTPWLLWFAAVAYVLCVVGLVVTLVRRLP